MNRLQGKVAIVTGAGRTGNIGVAVCDAFLREGARGVIGTDMRTDQAEAIAAQIESKHGKGRFHLVQHDVTTLRRLHGIGIYLADIKRCRWPNP